MKKMILVCIALLSTMLINAQDLISSGTNNSWIFHTPSDGRTSLHIAPMTNGTWDWAKEFTFYNNGDLKINGFINSDLRLGGNGNNWLVYHGGTSPGDLQFVPTVNGDWNWSKQISFTKDADLIVDGKIGIGSSNPDEKLTVKGKIHAEEIIVDLLVPADYVFQKYYTGSSALDNNYKMLSLEEVEEYTKKNHHLPEMPSAKEIQKEGLHLKEMTNLLLQKIEELTLYTIEQEKRIKALEAKLSEKK